MKSFALALVAWIFALTLGTTLPAQDAVGTIDDALLAKLQGEWRYADMTVNGKPQVRDWEDEDVSTFFELDGDVVVLEKKNGDEVRVPLEKLSAMDRKWVKDAGKK